MSLSRSNQPLKELFTGVHLVAITDAKPLDNSILVRFSDGHNKSFDKIYSMDSEFIKMCGDAGTISETSVFDDTHAIGKRLWIAIKEVWSDAETVNFYLFDTFPYVEGFNEPPEVKKELLKDENLIHSQVKLENGSIKPSDILMSKQKVIAEQRAMIAKVEAKKPDDEFEM